MNILLTSVGRRSYLVKYFKEALKNKGKVHVANSSNISPAFQVADKSVVTPLIYDDNYIPFLIKYCKENDIDAIVSLFDIDLPILSQSKARFKEIGTMVVVSDYNVIDICNDKWKSYNFLKDNGFNTPKTFISLDDAGVAIKNNEIHFPVMVKPRWGMGSIAVFEAENQEELCVFYNKTKRNILKSYLKYESKDDIENSVLIQEKLLGQEYGLDVINDLKGNYQTTVAKMKYAMRSGETDCAVTVDKPELKNIGEKLSKAMRHIANLDVDTFIIDDKVYVLEMNARFGGGYPFSHMAGVNLPQVIINWLQGEKPEDGLLLERINIMSQKDIELVRLYPENGLKLKIINDEKELFNAISILECQLIPSLSERKVDIKEYSKKLSQKAINLLLKDIHSNIAGFASAYFNDNITHTAYLTLLIVDSKFRGLHLGEKLINQVEAKARENNMLKVRLEVRKTNHNAIEFYQHMGYSITENNGINSFYMEKELSC